MAVSDPVQSVNDTPRFIADVTLPVADTAAVTSPWPTVAVRTPVGVALPELVTVKYPNAARTTTATNRLPLIANLR